MQTIRGKRQYRNLLLLSIAIVLSLLIAKYDNLSPVLSASYAQEQEATVQLQQRLAQIKKTSPVLAKKIAKAQTAADKATTAAQKAVDAATKVTQLIMTG